MIKRPEGGTVPEIWVRLKMKLGDVMRDSQCLDTLLKRFSEINGNKSKISIKRSSLDKTLCTDEGSLLFEIKAFLDALPSSSSPVSAFDEPPTVVSMKGFVNQNPNL